jgi:Ser/Thr protein kinase RdoA (MazF antagonist)
VASTEVSANVSTNHVYRLVLDGGGSVIAKVSSYGSYFLFREDHDRLHRCHTRLENTRFADLLADVLTRDGKAFTFHDADRWVAFYQEVPKLGSLPPILSDHQIANLATELAEFHLACHRVATTIPPSATSLVSDILYLLDLLSDSASASRFNFSAEELAMVRRHGEAFLEATDALGYDDWARIPVLVDWNLGNFSVEPSPNAEHFRLATRWDYDWFRIEPRQLDFYFLSRVSSATGDRSVFSYAPHTLLEPRFSTFLRAYSSVFPLTENELRFIPETYRFFILNYVIRAGASFFQPSLCARLQRDAVTLCLPALEAFNVEQLLDSVY